ncbi:MAG: helix-turn-helix domain-containing protein, partial [Clostridiales bacterium]|nr:helix-turn-helix domain-containing protein [Clostridiales bacterium]
MAVTLTFDIWYGIMIIIQEGSALIMGEVVKSVESIRLAHGLTQEQVADVLGVSRVTYINVT